MVESSRFSENFAARPELLLYLLEARFVGFREFGAREAEVADRILDDALARRVEAVEFGALTNLAVLPEQREVLAQLRVEARDLGQHLVVGLAPFRHVHDAVQVRDDAPGPVEMLAGVLERLHEAVPAWGGERLQAGNELPPFLEQAAHRGATCCGRMVSKREGR